MQSSFTECNEFHGGHLQPELIIVEFLDDNNRPVEEGEMCIRDSSGTVRRIIRPVSHFLY